MYIQVVIILAIDSSAGNKQDDLYRMVVIFW